MKTIAVLAVCLLLWTSSLANADDFGFNVAGLKSRAALLDARVQALQLQQRAQLARQVQFVQQQQLTAANTFNVHGQLAQLRALQQAQSLYPLQLNSFDLNQQHYAAPIVQHQAAVVVPQPVVIQRQVVHPQRVQQFCAPQRVRQFCAPQRVLQFRSSNCR